MSYLIESICCAASTESLVSLSTSPQCSHKYWTKDIYKLYDCVHYEYILTEMWWNFHHIDRFFSSILVEMIEIGNWKFWLTIIKYFSGQNRESYQNIEQHGLYHWYNFQLNRLLPRQMRSTEIFARNNQ